MGDNSSIVFAIHIDKGSYISEIWLFHAMGEAVFKGPKLGWVGMVAWYNAAITEDFREKKKSFLCL